MLGLNNSGLKITKELKGDRSGRIFTRHAENRPIRQEEGTVYVRNGGSGGATYVTQRGAGDLVTSGYTADQSQVTTTVLPSQTVHRVPGDISTNTVVHE